MEPNNETKNQIDYTELNRLRSGIFAANFGILSIIIISFFVAFMLQAASDTLPLFFLILALSVVGLIFCIYLNKKYSTANQAAIHAFANKNGYSYDPNPTIGSGSGTLFQRGHSKKTKHLIAGSIGSYSFELFTYKYETGSGKHRRTYDAHIMEVTLPRALPHMVIDSIVEEDMSVLPIQFDKSQRIQLEGDFHKYFELYAPDTYGVTALTILAPDAMEVLMRNAAFCDIEIIDHKLYFYWPLIASKRTGYERIFNTAIDMLAKAGDKLSKDNIFATHSQAQIHAVASSSPVRLKNSKIGIITILAGATYLLAEIFKDTEIAGVMTAPFIILIICGFIYTIARSLKNKKLRDELLNRYQLRP